LTTLFTPNGGELGQMVETAKHRKSLENTGKISIFKAFFFGGDEEISLGMRCIPLHSHIF
jgi:hypothetical protein